MTITPNPGTDWPDNYQGCTITGRFIDVSGLPVQGMVHFTPSPAALLNASQDVIVVSKRITATLDADGAFEITVPATDDPDVNPTGWTYEVFEDFAGGRKYSINAPQNEVVDLADISPVPNNAGNAIVVGPPGPKGDKGDTGTGNTALWLPAIKTTTWGSGYYDYQEVVPMPDSAITYGYTDPRYNESMTSVDVFAVFSGKVGPGHDGNIRLGFYWASKPMDGTNNSYFSLVSAPNITEPSAGSGYVRAYKVGSGLTITPNTMFHGRVARYGSDATDTATAANGFMGLLVKPAE